jgi:hypothetical protein
MPRIKTGMPLALPAVIFDSVSSFRLRARLDLSIPSAFSGQRGNEPRFLDMAPLI